MPVKKFRNVEELKAYKAPHEFRWPNGYLPSIVEGHDWSATCGADTEEEKRSHLCEVCSKPYSDPVHKAGA